MAISIRLARTSDAKDIARLATQLGYDVKASMVAARLSRMLARPDQQFFVADDDGRVVGWLHAAVAEFIEVEAFVVIGGLVVDEHYRRKGLGRLLMRRAEDWARTNGCSVVRLWSSVSRTAAHAFYQDLGYTKIKTQHSFAKSLDPADDDLKRFIPRVSE
jgi:GNAT superfamily N-acetyltransferase